ncbi:MAG: C40 family peptidase [Bacteroidota bacterium]
MSKKIAFCKVSISPLRKESSDASEMVSQLLFGELVEIEEVKNNWTKVTTFFDNYEAWTDTKHLIYLSEKEVNRHLDGLTIETTLIREIQTPWGNQFITRGAFIHDEASDFNIGQNEFSFLNRIEEENFTLESYAKSYLNAPYLWGGKSPFGIDCSGFTQQVFRYFDKKIPRDAYQQAEHGMEIDFDDKLEGDLAFFSNSSGKITHVGIVLNDSQIIHASGQVKIDVLKKDGIYSFDEKTHDLISIKRI